MRTHNRNFLIYKVNRFYRKCKCSYGGGPVGVTENPAEKFQRGFLFFRMFVFL